MINSDNKSNGPIDTIEAEYHKGADGAFYETTKLL